jgi:hypothetical protein
MHPSFQMLSYPAICAAAASTFVAFTLAFLTSFCGTLLVSCATASSIAIFLDDFRVTAATTKLAFFGDFLGFSMTSSSTSSNFLFPLVTILFGSEDPTDARFFGLEEGSAAEAVLVLFVDIVL